MSDSKGCGTSSTRVSLRQRGKEAAKNVEVQSGGRASSVNEYDMKAKLKEDLVHDVEESNESTHVYAKKPGNPSTVSMDDCDTVTDPIRKKQTKLINAQPANGEAVQRAKPDPNKIAEILAGPSLRERYSHLLPPHMILPIGYRFTKLLEKVGCMEATLSFLQLNRGRKANFFADLRKNIHENLRIDIEEDTLRQILFLAPGFYSLCWEKNERIKKYDIVIRMPPGCTDSEEERKAGFRRAIVDYLTTLHQEFLSKQHHTQKTSSHQWHPKFNIQEVEIPLGKLPEHPLEKNISVSAMAEKDVKAIDNKRVRQVVQSERQLSLKSDTKSAAASFLEQKKEYGSFTNRLFEIVREKERKMKEAQLKKEISLEATEDADLMVRILQEVLEIYMGKAISNMFMVTVLDMLQRRMSTFTKVQLQKGLEDCINGPVKFLEEVAHPKGKILRMDKSKYNEALNHYQRQLAQ